MKLLFKSLVFGIILTAILSLIAYGLATVVTYLGDLGVAYQFGLVLAFICAVCSTTYYFGNK